MTSTPSVHYLRQGDRVTVACGHNGTRATADPAKVTCRNCLRTIKREEAGVPPHFDGAYSWRVLRRLAAAHPEEFERYWAEEAAADQLIVHN